MENPASINYFVIIIEYWSWHIQYSHPLASHWVMFQKRLKDWNQVLLVYRELLLRVIIAFTRNIHKIIKNIYRRIRGSTLHIFPVTLNNYMTKQNLMNSNFSLSLYILRVTSGGLIVSTKN